MKPPRLSEADVVQQVKDYLSFRGWRPIRMGRGMIQNAYGQVSSFGQPGMPDWLFLRYIEDAAVPGACVALWVETKANGAKAKCRCATKKKMQRCTKCDQRAFRERERRLGAQVWTIDSIESFMAAYEATFAYLHRGDTAIGQTELEL